MAKVRYEPILVQRTPQSSSAPTLTEIDEIIIKERLAWKTELIGDGFISFSLEPEQQSQEIKNALLNIAEVACEIKLYRNGVAVQAGPIIGVQTQGPTITLICRGLLYYLRYMFVTSDLVYTAVDQYTIAKGIVDHWQNLTYGDFGIDTSGIGASGFNRTITYYANEAPGALKVIENLADNLDGFEFHIDPGTRDLVLEGQKGSDKSASVILDKRAIVSPNSYFSVGRGDYANHAIAIGADQDLTTPVVGSKTNATEMAKFGRAGFAISVDSVSQQSIIDDYAQTLLDVADHLHIIPGSGSAFPVQGAGVDDFEVGDKVTWIYDYGLGLLELQRDVFSRTVQVDKAGTESMTVEFL